MDTVRIGFDFIKHKFTLSELWESEGGNTQETLIAEFDHFIDAQQLGCMLLTETGDLRISTKPPKS